MKNYSAISFFVCVASCLVPVQSNAAECDKQYLIDRIKKAPMLSARPEFAWKKEAALQRISLQSIDNSNDTYRVDAVFDFKSKIAWIVKYGGIDGQDYWQGPIKIHVDSFVKCPEIIEKRDLTINYDD